jgi:hypothetical protein
VDPGLQHFLFPELRGLEASERAMAFRSARETPYDVGELVGMAAAHVIAAALASRPWLALALGAALVAFFSTRRLRRGLRRSTQAALP